MPRLLLVDDNPSIHKIAETLLAASDVQLVSCGSGAQAMALIEQGDHFDVALLDTSMAGMDGWALLERIRSTEATARIPVAMMAGVLDLVDPEKLRNAPIQGFLKKPVELRDLGDRVRRLMEAPVLPPAPRPASAPEAFLTHPGLRIPELLKAAPAEDDILLLGPEDLFAEAEAPQDEPDGSATLEIPLPPAAGPLPEAEDEPLDLEELDLEGLRGLTFPAPELAVEAPSGLEPPARPALEPEPDFTVPEFLLADTLPETGSDLGWDNPEYSGILPDLGPAGAEPVRGTEPPAALGREEFFDWSDESDSLVGLADSAAPAAAPGHGLDDRPEAITLSDILDPPMPRLGFVTPSSLKLEEADLDALPLPPAGPAAAALPGVAPELAPTPKAEPLVANVEPMALTVPAPFHPAQDLALDALPAASPVSAAAPVPDPLQAILADPVLMDRLAHAVVARLSDQVLREVAWEVMPELAARLHAGDTP